MRKSVFIVVTFGFFYLLYTPKAAEAHSHDRGVACVSCKSLSHTTPNNQQAGVCVLDWSSTDARCDNDLANSHPNNNNGNNGCTGSYGVCTNPFAGTHSECQTCYGCPASCFSCMCINPIIVTPDGADPSCSKYTFLNTVE